MLIPTQMGEAGRGLVWSHSGLYSLHSLVEDDQGLWWENEVIIIMLLLLLLMMMAVSIMRIWSLVEEENCFGETKHEAR